MSGAAVGKGRRLLAVAHLLEVVLPAARLVIFARLMPSEEFGLAVVLTLIFSAAELLTDFGLQQGILRTDPRNPDTLRSYHSLGLVRAGAVGLGLVLLAPVNAWLFTQPGHWIVFAVPGVLFAIRGLVSLAPRLAARDFDFTPDALVMIATQLVWTLAALGAALLLGNHVVALIGMAAAVLTQVVVSNLLSPGRFSLGWDRAIVREAWQFGYPLLPNGFALAITSMGDRLVLGAHLGVRTLALYTPLVTLAMMPRGTILRYANSILLPSFIARAEAKLPLEPLLRIWSRLLALLGLALALGLIALAPVLIALLFGAAYVPPVELTILVAMLIYVRMLLGLPVPAALATGHTQLVTWGSLATALSLVPAGAVLWMTGRLDAFVATMVVFESCSFILIAFKLGRTYGIPVRALAWDWVLCAGLVAILAVLAWLQPRTVPELVAAATGLAAVALVVLRADRVIRAALSGRTAGAPRDGNG